MAPPPDHVYFPTLEELLEGETVLISWKLIASVLSDPTGDRLASTAVTEFLKDPYVLDLLKSPAKVFEPPTSQTAAALETKTAAINVTPTPTDKYDIQAVKADTLWLSKSAHISEVSALRVVVTELQARPQAFLAGPLSSQDATNIQKAAAGSMAATQTAADAEDLWTDFGSQTSQRRRLLATYLSERCFFAMSVDYVTSLIIRGPSLLRDGDTNTDADTDADAAASATLTATIEALRSGLIQGTLGLAAGADLDTRLYLPSIPTFISALRACMKRAEEGIEATMKEKETGPPVLTEALAIEWVQTALTESVHYLSVIFLVLQSCGHQFLPPPIAAEWFRFVGDYRFLDGLVPANDTMAELVRPLQTLVCVNSLLLLNLNRAIAYLDHDVEIDTEVEEPYINDADVLEVIHNAIVRAAEEVLPTASPVFLSWSLILHRMDVSYQERAERRDLAQNQRAQDGFELDNQPFPAQPLQPRGRRSSVGSIVSIEAARYDGFLSDKVLSLAEGEALVPRLAMTATDQCQVYDVVSAMAACGGCGVEAAFRPGLGARIRLVFLELLKAGFPIVGYQSDPLSALLAVLSGGPEPWSAPVEDETVAAAVLRDEQLMQFYVHNAMGRFPYEFTPFVAMCRALSTCTSAESGLSDVVLNLLLQTPSLTFVLPPGFEGYVMIDEDDEHATATMQTTEDIPLFPSGPARRRRLAYHNDNNKSVAVVPAGSYGRFMIDGSGIVNIDYTHSTIALLGKRLDANLADEPHDAVLGLLQKSDAAETIGLLVALVRSEMRKAGGDGARAAEAGLAILQEASRDLDQAKDIVSVVGDTLDTIIQDGPAETDESRMAVLAACMDFLLAVLPLCPGRVWPYMARCQLLNTESSAGRLTILTGASDVVSERFHFLMASIRFLSGLVSGALTSAVQRKVLAKRSSNSSGRGGGEENVWLGASDKTIAQVCLAVAQTVVDIYENTSTWKFASEMHRSGLVAGAVGILRDIVVYASSLEVPAGQESLVACFDGAADFVVRSFLSSSSSSLRFQPLLTTLLLGLELPQSTLHVRRRDLVVERVVAALELSASLLRVASAVGGDGGSAGMETQIFQIASLPARLCALSARLKRPALELLTELVVSAAASTANEPPSLLGYLGPPISRCFLAVLSTMDKPFQRPAEAARVWKFFSTVLRHRQQWMANCLLTGKTPREALKADGAAAQQLSADSVLAKAKAALGTIASLPRLEALAILDFFAAAQNYWPWTIFAVRSADDYLDSMRAYVRGLLPAAATAKTDALAACGEARMAAYVAETFAMQLYHMRQTGTDEAFARDVVQDLDYYLRDGAGVSGYNASLHGNFQRNFGSRYGGFALAQLKRTLLQRRDLGPQYYYALDLADRMLSFDAAWAGAGAGGRSNNKGFRREMQMANLNLSLVDAQIALFRAWELLLLELSVCLLPQSQRLSVVMLQVAEQCLAASQDGSQGPEPIFAALAQSRASLALLLLQRLAACALLPPDLSPLLLSVWSSLGSVKTPWAPEQAPYYRTLLRILYVVLRGPRQSAASDGSDGSDAVVSTTQTVLNVLDRVVAHGFRTLVSMVHDPEAVARPEDLALLTAVLQACLSTPGMSQCQTQVLNIMAAHDVLHVAVSLFSWADKLRGGGGGDTDDKDPVYGELSLLFLLELSALPAVAEQLACDGFLGHLAAAGLAAHLRRPGVSPFADAAGPRRCYSVWAKAVLPLLLNLLIALGTSIAPEIAYVLNQFPTLLQASVQRFEAPGLRRTSAATLARDGGPPIALLAVAEVHALALLTQVLAALRVNHARDIPAVAWDAAPVLESIDFWLSRPKLLRERLVPLGGREAEWRTMEPQRKGGLAENRLEEKVFSLLDAVRTILGEEEE